MGGGASGAKVFVVILNWNGLKDTLECVESVQKIDYINLEVVVVDNRSTDGSPETLRAVFPGITVLETGANLGWAGGNNVGIRYALANGAEWVFLLNNDTVVDPGVGQNLVAVGQRYPQAGALGPKIYRYGTADEIWYAGARWQSDNGTFIHIGQGQADGDGRFTQVEETDYACGCAMLVRSEAFRCVGLFDPQFFLLFEESDWCYRARQDGYRSLFVPSAKVWHKVSRSLGGRGGVMWTYFNFRNELIWGKRHLPKDEWQRLAHRSIATGQRAAARVLARGIRGGCIELRDLVLLQAGLDYLLGRSGDCPQWIRKCATRAS